VAPAENQSGKGHSITIGDPLYADVVELPGGLKATAVVATPVTLPRLCRMAVTVVAL